MKVLITGGSGFVGNKLGQALVARGHECVVITRNQKTTMLSYPAVVVEGDLSQAAINHPQLRDVEVIVHLMGESVADGRWSAQRKARLQQSRIAATKNLQESLRLSGAAQVRKLVSASAIGYFGDRGDEWLAPDSAPMQPATFLSALCEQWEASGRELAGQQMQLAIVRIGLVLSHEHGALKEMLTPFQLGVGGPLGSGKAWMSWIHIDDLVAMFTQLVESQESEGVVHAVAPEPVRNRDWTRELARHLGVPAFMPVPELALKVLFGEMAVILTSSQRVKSTWPASAFKFATLAAALADLCEPLKSGCQILVREQFIPLPPEQVFPFFAEARNLGKITPDSLHFKILSVNPEPISEGTLIDYNLRIRGVPVHWRTRIESWKPAQQFVDTQLKGPYTKWWHKHDFVPLGKGTMMRDTVIYKVPIGWLGSLVAGKFVQSEVKFIFDYRRKVIHQLYGG